MKEVTINVSSSGDTDLVAAVATKAYAIIQMFLVPAADVTFQIKGSANIKVGGISLIGNTLFKLEKSDIPWVTLAKNEALRLNLSAAVQVGGRITYEEFDF